MGAKQSALTKNTFINVDIRGIDEERAADGRQVRSWGGPATRNAVEDSVIEEEDPARMLEVNLASVKTASSVSFEQLLQEHSVQVELLEDESAATRSCRFKTFDAFDDQLDPEESFTSSHSSDTVTTCEPPSKAESFESLPQKKPVHDAQRVGVPVVPVLVVPVARATPTFITGQIPIMWAWSPPLASNTSAREQAAQPSPTPPRPPSVPGTHNKEDSQTESTVATSSTGPLTWTCRMVRNLPNDYSRQDVVDLLDSWSIQYNFLYVPIDWAKGANLGYAFVNLASHDEALRIGQCLSGFSNWKVSSEKKCEIVWGKPEQQLLHRIVERYRNSPVMHPDVPEQFKPLLFSNGRRIAFPEPTRKLHPPQGIHTKK